MAPALVQHCQSGCSRLRCPASRIMTCAGAQLQFFAIQKTRTEKPMQPKQMIERRSRLSRVGTPMPLGFHPHPGGIFDNSPPFQRWVRRFGNLQVPKGRLKPRDLSAVPSGLTPVGRCFPNVETLGYYRMSLRDKESDTFSKLPRSNPSGIGAPALRRSKFFTFTQSWSCAARATESVNRSRKFRFLN